VKSKAGERLDCARIEFARHRGRPRGARRGRPRPCRHREDAPPAPRSPRHPPRLRRAAGGRRVLDASRSGAACGCVLAAGDVLMTSVSRRRARRESGGTTTTTRLVPLNVPLMLVATVLVCGSGCAKPDWIQQTLVTVDVTGTWVGSIGGVNAAGGDPARVRATGTKGQATPSKVGSRLELRRRATWRAA